MPPGVLITSSPSRFRFRLLLVSLLLTLAAVTRSRGAETVLLGDQFLDNERVTQTLPTTAKWLYAGQAAAASRLWVTPPASSGVMRLVVSGGSDAMALAYFTAAGSPVTLAAGDSLSLDFTAKLDALTNSDSDFRVALFNSLGTRPTADSEDGTYDATSPYPYRNKHSGYGAFMNTGAVTDSFNLVERNTQGSDMPFASTTVMGADNQATLGLKVKQNFPVHLKVTRTSSTVVTIEATVNGVTVTRTDAGSGGAILTAFDGFGFYLSGSALASGQAVTVSALTVTYTPSGGAAATLLNETFTDNERLTQSLPASAQWFYAGPETATARLTCATPASTQELVFTPGGQAAMSLAYFTASGSPKALAVGESITFQANVHLDLLQNAADGIRFGLFNSGGSRATGDYEGGVNVPTTYDVYRGYSVSLNPGASGGFNVYLRGGTGQNPFTAAASTLVGSSNVADLALTTSPSQVPRFSMTVTRLSSGMQIDAAINGRSVVRTETTATPTATAFDTLAFFTSSAATAYDGPQVVLDEVTVIHSTAIPAVASVGKILTETFDGTAWASAAFAGTQATGTVASGSFGTINVLGRVLPSGGLKLDVNATGLSGYWSGALNSGVLTATNAETNLGKLTLAFDLKSSAVRPVRVRLESTNSGGTVGGTLEKLIYPAVPGSFQRYAFELSDMTATGGTFSPTSGYLKLTFQIEGGVDASSWPAGTHSLQLDNVYYAKPAYYVTPGGAGSKNGLSEANAFSSIATALATATHPGDIIMVMPGTGSPSYTLTDGLGMTAGGVPGGWITLKNYPGTRPLIQRAEPDSNDSYDILLIGKGSGTVDATNSANYIEIRGLRWRGTADTLATADQGQPTAKSNLNGISATGRAMIKCPHHIRFADNEVYNVAAGGLSSIDVDWWFVENNDLHDNSNWTIYGTSGISSLTPWNFDGTAGTYRHFWLNNRSYRNETKKPWAQIGAISDGNGAILDTFLDTRHGPYLGRSIVANNLFYENGGSGVHAFKVNGADIVNNTAVRNSHSPALSYANIFAASSNDVVIANNVMVASTGEPINGASYSTAYPLTTGVRFLNNVYQSDGSTNAPVAGTNDAGNVTTTDVKFVNDATGTNDYRLKTGSPAFNAGISNASLAALGVPAVLPVRDLLNVLRSTDGTPDAGAFERQPAIVAGPASQTITSGGSVTFSITAQSAGTPSGLTYQWQRNGANLAGATGATLTLTGVASANAGTYRAVVSVGGATPFDAVTSPAATLTVQPAASATALTTSASSATYGSPVTFTATVTSGGAGTPTGTVTFLDGGTALGTGTLNASGVTTLTTGTLAVGSHSITASYGGSADHAASTSSVLTQTILLRPTATALASSANPATYGASVTFTATVTGPAGGTPAGNVTFFDNGVALGAASALNASGVATFVASGLGVGSHPITAAYGGNATYATSTSGALTQTIQAAATNTTLASNANPATYGTGVTFTATVASAAGTPAGTVTFLDNGAAIGTGTLAGGVATLTASGLTIGSHPITASYGGSVNHDVSVSPTLTQTIQSVFDAWRAENFSPAQLGDPAISGATADPDGDGFSNLMEFAFGTNPNNGTSGPGSITYNGGGAITLRAQPAVSVANAGDFRVVFGRRKNRVAAGLTYAVQFSANLTTWETNDDNANPPATVATDAEMDAVTVPYPVLLSTGEKAQFFRVVVSLP